MPERVYKESRIALGAPTRDASVRVPARKKSDHFTGVVLLFLLFPLILIVATIAEFPPHAFGGLFDASCAALGTVLLVVMLWWRLKRGFLDWTEPPVWTSIWVYLNVVAPTWLLDRNGVPQIAALNYSVDMPKAVALIGVGLVALWAGYIASTQRHARRQPNRPPMVAQTFLIWIFGAVLMAWSGLADAGSSGSVSVFDKWLNYVAFFCYLSVLARSVLLIYYLRVRPRFGWILVAVSVVYEVGFSVVAAKKGFAISLLMLAMCVYYGAKQLRVGYCLLAGLLVLFFVPVVNTFRVNKALSFDASFDGRISALSKAVGEVANTSAGELSLDVANTVVGRQGSMLATTASVMAHHPTVLPYEGLELGGEFLRALMPRALWPAKPAGLSSLYMNTTRYWGASTEYALTAIGQFADAYRAGGWIFVVAWFMLSGWFLGYLYQRGAAGRDPISSAWYITLLFVVFYYENDLTTCALRIVTFCPLMWFAMRYLMTGTRRESL